MEFRTRCRIVPALFALTFCAVPVLAQEEPEPSPSEDARTAPTAGQDPFVQAPGTPGGQVPQPGFPGQGGRPPMAQPGFGQPGMGFNPLMMQSPEMAKKMRAIMALREMWQLRLTAKDINAILPPLRELAESERNLQTRTEKILEEERKALLTADPDGEPPDGSSELMQRENDLFRIKSDDTWRAIDKTIGKNKTNGIRRLLGMGGQAPFNNSGDAVGGFGGRGGTPPNPQGIRPGAGGRGFGGGDNFEGNPPPSGGGFGGGSDSLVNPTQPAANGADRPSQNRAPRGRGGDGLSGAPRPGGHNFQPTPGGNPAIAQQNRPFNPQGMPGMPMMPQVRISITEFVGLLGEKLAAMRK